MIFSGVFFIWLFVFGAPETRGRVTGFEGAIFSQRSCFLSCSVGTILLARRAKKLRKTTGDSRYRTAVDPPNLRQLVWISTTRPVCEHRAVYKRTSLHPNTMKDLLFTEPIVASFSVSITAIVLVGTTMLVS